MGLTDDQSSTAGQVPASAAQAMEGPTGLLCDFGKVGAPPEVGGERDAQDGHRLELTEIDATEGEEGVRPQVLIFIFFLVGTRVFDNVQHD